MMMADGRVTSRAIEGVPDPEGKFKMYASYSEPASKIPSHRMLAIRRGAKEGVLTFEIELDPQQPQAWLRARVVRKPGDWVPHLEAGHRRFLRPPAQSLDPDRSAPGTEGSLRRRGHQGLPREPGEPAALAAGRPLTVLAHRPGHSHRLQARRGGRYRQVPGRCGHLSVRAEERSRRLRQDAGVADCAPQRAGHRDRQRHGVARIGGLRAGLPAPGQPDEDLQRDGERIGRQRLLGIGNGAAGVPRSRPHGARRHLDRAPLAGSAGRTREGGPEVDRRRPVSARRGSAPLEAESRSDGGKLREPRRCGSEYRVVGAPALRGGNYGAHRGEDRGIPQRARALPLAHGPDGGAGLRARRRSNRRRASCAYAAAAIRWI